MRVLISYFVAEIFNAFPRYRICCRLLLHLQLQQTGPTICPFNVFWHLFTFVFNCILIFCYFYLFFFSFGGREGGRVLRFLSSTYKVFFFGWMNVMKFQFGYTICIIYFVYGLWFWGIYVLWSENDSVNWPRSLTERNRFEINTHLMLKIFQLYTCMSIRNKKNCVNMGHKLHAEAFGRLKVVYTC